jgi:hypothetical protein
MAVLTSWEFDLHVRSITEHYVMIDIMHLDDMIFVKHCV